MLEFPLINDTSRKIIHIDMDAFFAQVEMRDDPSLKDKPVIIGNDPRKTGGRGVVSTCNYEARKYGVHSAMSSKEAYERCPNAVFISGNYSHYREVGMQIREIFKCYTDLVEPMTRPISMLRPINLGSSRPLRSLNLSSMISGRNSI